MAFRKAATTTNTTMTKNADADVEADKDDKVTSDETVASEKEDIIGLKVVNNTDVVESVVDKPTEVVISINPDSGGTSIDKETVLHKAPTIQNATVPKKAIVEIEVDEEIATTEPILRLEIFGENDFKEIQMPTIDDKFQILWEKDLDTRLLQNVKILSKYSFYKRHMSDFLENGWMTGTVIDFLMQW